MTLTKIQMAENLIERCGLDRRVAKQFVEQFFEEIRATLARGEEVKLSGFGNFEVREKGARPGRNPKTGEAAEVSARRVVMFKPSQLLRERVQEANEKAKTKPSSKAKA